MRQAFFRLGEVILEVVGGQEPDPQGGPARFYGIAVTVADLDAASRTSAARGSAQSGGAAQAAHRHHPPRAGLAARVALMSPEPTRP